MESIPCRAETGLAEERMELDSRKKSRCDKIAYQSVQKSFDTQEMREIGRKESGKLKSFSILWMRII